MAVKLLIATRNPAKFAVYHESLRQLQLELVSLTDLGITNDVPEAEATFEANAWHKAQMYHAQANLPVIADDSGLEIDALNGWPGVYSRRVWGPTEREATDEEARAEVLKRMASVPDGNRRAHFMAVSVLIMPNGTVHVAESRANGEIAREPAGPLSPGFPYDTIFYLPERGKTAAEVRGELGPDYLPLRKKAILQLEPYLKELANI